jgi:hypothetical protein
MTSQQSEPLTDFQKQIIEKIAAKIVKWHGAVPAIFTLESMKPLSFVGSQFLIAVGPFAEVIFKHDEYEQFALAMESRDNVEYLLLRIESLDADARNAEKAARKRARELRREKRQARRARRLQAKAAGEDN